MSIGYRVVHLVGDWGYPLRATKAACGTRKGKRLTTDRSQVTCRRCVSFFGTPVFERRVSLAEELGAAADPMDDDETEGTP